MFFLPVGSSRTEQRELCKRRIVEPVFVGPPMDVNATVCAVTVDGNINYIFPPSADSNQPPSDRWIEHLTWKFSRAWAHQPL